MSKLTIKIHSFYFNDGTYVKWFPADDSGKVMGLFKVVIEFPPTDRGSDTLSFSKLGPPTGHASKYLLKWAIKDRKNLKK
jgi:hypothetical protein